MGTSQDLRARVSGLLRSAQVLVDSKDFRGARQDYEEALRLTPGAPFPFEPGFALVPSFKGDI